MMQKGKIRTKRVEDEQGVWIYKYEGTWGFPDIESIQRVEDKERSAANPEVCTFYED